MNIVINSDVYICVRNCDNQEVNSLINPTSRIYNYTFGDTYTYYVMQARKYNYIYYNNQYHGLVTDNFVNSNFIKEEKFHKTLSEVDLLFENIFFNHG